MAACILYRSKIKYLTIIYQELNNELTNNVTATTRRDLSIHALGCHYLVFHNPCAPAFALFFAAVLIYTV